MSQNVISSNNLFAFFNQYIDARDIGFEEGNQGRDTGTNPPHMNDKRLAFFLGGMIRSAYNALYGDYGASTWLKQTRENLDKALARYHNEAGEVDIDLALTDPRILKLQDYVESQQEEVEAYNLFYCEALDAYKQVFREAFDITTLQQQTNNSPTRKVELTDEQKADAVARLQRLTKKVA